MLSLVDYAGSDDEDIYETQNKDCCIYAEVVSNPIKCPSSANMDNEMTDGFFRQDGAAVEEYDGVTNAEGPSILTNLPPPIPLVNKRVQQEKELDDLVKRKDWEVELVKEIERKRKHHQTDSSKKYHASKDLEDSRSDAKKLVVIDAFSGLKGLVDNEKREKCEEQPDHSMVASSSANLLTLLPETKNSSGIPRNMNLFMSGSAHSTGNSRKSKVFAVREIPRAAKSTEECDDSSDEDHDSTDFFGLKTIYNPPVTSLSKIPFEREVEKVEHTNDGKVENNVADFICHPEITADCHDISTSTTLPGTIDDNQALGMIYSRDVAHLGGTVSNAAEALENMVDVSVDKVLGPNVHATLLKNLHNKSLAEATLSHLNNIPKGKEGISMVARRKHQITYLASVAVAREEQLAEQWSVNRHNKRTSARKYGF